jgi:hypothetical protein
MSSLRRINASRANGRLSKGPATSDGQGRSSANAIRHGLLAKCVVLENESGPCFDRLVTEHTRRFAPADGVEFGMIEEMAAAYWRMRRAWAIENRLMEKALRHQPPGDEAARIAAAFSELAATPELNLLHRYEARLHRIYQRALFNLTLLGERELPNEANPISEHQAVQAPAGPDPQVLLAPPDSGAADLLVLICG